MQSIQKWPTDDNFNPNGHGTDGGETAPVDSGAERRHAQKMEALGRLACGVAHDFNNLLTIILGLCEIGLDAKAEDPILAEIDRAGQRAADLTRQLLAFSRKQVLAPVPLKLNSLVSNLEKMIRRLIGEDIDLSTLLDPQLAAVQADPGQIEQVIMNLVINSRDAMPTGGRLTIRTANIVPDAGLLAKHPGAQPGDYVLLAITDTGRGMDEQTQSRIFEPFFTTKAQGKGTGLGLATVYGIVEQSAGFIDVESSLGASTSMNIYLPRMEAATTPPAETRPARNLPGGTETILLVEDEQGVRSLARRALESRGYRVLEAGNGLEALEVQAAYDGEIHLLLTDVVMPQLGGRELADRLVAKNPQTSVLFMSGYTDDAIVRHGVREDGVPFLQKPFTPDALGRKVREVLSSLALATVSA
jgi:two-component system, cell cycle sensor histidine kinase and response regulator CckA